METIGAIDFAVIGAYFLIIFSIAAYVTKKERSSTSAQGYFLGGRDLGWFAIGASLFASNIGSEHLIGLSGSGARGAFPEAQFEILALQSFISILFLKPASTLILNLILILIMILTLTLNLILNLILIYI